MEENIVHKFVLGAISCAAPVPIVNPIEVIKIRLQLQGELDATQRKQGAFESLYGKDSKYKGTFRGIMRIVKSEGVRGLYKGVTPAILREMSYAAFRLAFYDPIKTLLGEKKGHQGSDLPFWKKLVAGASAGGIGAAFANPTDVLKVRMQANESQRIYKNTWDGLATIVRNEGVTGLWKGVVPNVQRACVISAAMMSTYDHCKTLIIRHRIVEKDGLTAHAFSSMIAGFMMAIASCPIDVAKTRIMNKAHDTPYSGMIDCLWKTLKSEGLQGLYKGFLPTFMRLGPHTIMAFVIFEQLRKWAGMTPV